METHRTTLQGHCTTDARFREYYFLDGTKVTSTSSHVSWQEPYPLWTEDVYASPLIKGDHVAPNPWGYLVHEDHFPVGSMSYYSPDKCDTWMTFSGAIGGFIPLPSWDLSDTAISLAQVSARNKAIKEFYSKMGFGGAGVETDVGEIAQTARLLESTAKNLVKPVKAFATLSRSLLSRWGFARIPASAYLGYIFGIRPIVEDIKNVLNVIATQSTTLNPISSRKSAKISFEQRQDGWVTNYSGEAIHQIGGMFSVEEQWIYDQTRMGILGPTTLAWELLPFSFVADWVVGVGDFLTSTQLALRNGCSLSHGYESQTTILRRSGVYSLSEKSSDGGYRTAFADMFGRRVGFSRTLMPVFPSPQCPSIKVSLGEQKLVTLGSMLTQALPATRRWFR